MYRARPISAELMGRFLGPLWLLLAAACGGTPADDEQARDASMADSASVPDAGAPVCHRASVDPTTSGSPVWTKAEAEACDRACPDADAECFTANCPRYAAHAQCVADQFDACVTLPEGVCRGPWEAAVCCARERCADVTDTELDACIERDCERPLAGFVDCADAAFADEAGDACFEAARADCLSAAPSVSEAGGEGGQAKRRSAASRAPRSPRTRTALRAADVARQLAQQIRP